MRRISGSWTSEFSTHSGRARFLPEWNRLCARSVTNGTNLGNGHGRSSLRPISQLFSDRPTNTRLAARAVCVKCAFLCAVVTFYTTTALVSALGLDILTNIATIPPMVDHSSRECTHF